MSTRVRMLTTATGPYLHLEAGKIYDLPDDLAKSFLAPSKSTTEEEVTVDGKIISVTRELKGGGPYAQLYKSKGDEKPRVEKQWKRNPNEGVDGAT